MARIEPVKRGEVVEELKPVFEMLEKQFGLVPNIFATIARYPKALRPILDLYQVLSKMSSIEPGLQEMVNLEVSRINHCNYCVTHHVNLARKYGVTNEKIEAIKSGKLGEQFSPKERVALEYAREVTQDAEHVSDELFSQISSYFSDSEIVNLTLIIGLMNIFNRFNEALKVELEKI